MRKSILWAPMLGFVASGCASHIDVTRFVGTPDTMRGVPYNLPMTQFTLTITRRVVDCSGGQLEGDVQVAVTSKTAIDPSAMFTLHSAGLLNTSDIKVSTNSDSTVSSLNASSTDQTGAVIGSVVSTIAKLAPLAIGGGAGAQTCTQPLIDALAAIGRDKDKDHAAVHGLKDDVQTENDKLAAVNARITLLSAQISALGKDAGARMHKALSDALDDQFKLQQSLNAHQAALTKALTVVTDVETETWPTSGSEHDIDPNHPYALPDAVWQKWAVRNFDTTNGYGFNIYPSIVQSSSYGAAATARVPLASIDPQNGLPVRYAVPAMLQICKNAPCGTTLNGHASEDVAHLLTPVLQFGIVYSVPATGGTFKATTFTLQLDANGNPTMVEVADQAAVLSGLASTVGNAATTLAGIPDAVKAEKLSSLTATTNITTEQTALAAAQAANATVAQLAPIQADVALKQAELAQIQAAQAFTAAQKASAGS